MILGTVPLGAATLAGPTGYSAVVAALSLQQAAVERARGSADLVGALPGGFHATYADPDSLAAGAYGVLFEVATADRHNTSGRVGYDARYQASFFGEDPDHLIEVVRPAWYAAFRPGMDPLLVAGEYHMVAYTTGSKLAQDYSRGPAAAPVFHLIVEFTCMRGVQPPA
jgi:hypothetical protein